MQKLTVDELKRLLYDTFCEHLSMKDIENIIMTEEESHMGTAEECPVEVESEWGRGGDEAGGEEGPRADPGRPHSLLQPADQADVRAEKPHLRLRHRLHHQRDAHRRQPGAAQRHEVARIRGVRAAPDGAPNCREQSRHQTPRGWREKPGAG